MRILRKLLDNLGDVWNKLPKEVPFLTIGKGTGMHSMVTVDEGVLHFHSVPFRSELPQKQSITLKSMTTQELLVIIASMGYAVSLTSEALASGLDVNKPFILMEVENVAMGKTLNAFTSNLWRTMYPLYRVLRQTEFDTEQALKQLHRQLADGEWLDFWASFFTLTREPGESDNNFVRRFTMWLFNPKTNNIALKELLAYRLQDTDFDVRDKAPLQFDVYLGIKYLDNAAELHKILREARGAGIEYFLNYFAPTYSEDWKQAAADFAGKPFENLDTVSVQPTITRTETYPAPSEALTDKDVSVTRTEAYTKPSEAAAHAVSRTLVETWVPPVDTVSRTLQSILSETYAQPSEVRSGTLLAPYADAYALPLGSKTSCFEIGVSALNNSDAPEADALFDSMKAQDAATAIVTVGGTEVARYSI